MYRPKRVLEESVPLQIPHYSHGFAPGRCCANATSDDRSHAPSCIGLCSATVNRCPTTPHDFVISRRRHRSPASALNAGTRPRLV